MAIGDDIVYHIVTAMHSFTPEFISQAVCVGHSMWCKYLFIRPLTTWVISVVFLAMLQPITILPESLIAINVTQVCVFGDIGLVSCYSVETRDHACPPMLLI